MELGLLLIVVGLLVGLFLSWVLGIILVIAGVLALFAPRLR